MTARRAMRTAIINASTDITTERAPDPGKGGAGRLFRSRVSGTRAGSAWTACSNPAILVTQPAGIGPAPCGLQILPVLRRDQPQRRRTTGVGFGVDRPVSGHGAGGITGQPVAILPAGSTGVQIRHCHRDTHCPAPSPCSLRSRGIQTGTYGPASNPAARTGFSARHPAWGPACKLLFSGLSRVVDWKRNAMSGSPARRRPLIRPEYPGGHRPACRDRPARRPAN